MPNSERSGRVEPWQQAFVDAYAKLEPGEIMLRSRWQRRTVDDLMIDMLTTYRMAMATSESFRRTSPRHEGSSRRSSRRAGRERRADGRPSPKRDRRRGARVAVSGSRALVPGQAAHRAGVCPCGKSEITITHLMAAWPGEDPLCREP